VVVLVAAAVVFVGRSVWASQSPAGSLVGGEVPDQDLRTLLKEHRLQWPRPPFGSGIGCDATSCLVTTSDFAFGTNRDEATAAAGVVMSSVVWYVAGDPVSASVPDELQSLEVVVTDANQAAILRMTCDMTARDALQPTERLRPERPGRPGRDGAAACPDQAWLARDRTADGA
jgi:hypothetical protein